MGMFDTLISDDYETQVKCFYIPMYEGKCKGYFNKLISHLGGSMQEYKIGDSVPTKTIYYEYSDVFLIYLQDGFSKEEYDFALFKDEQFEGFYKLDDIELDKYENIFSNVYDYRGRKLKVKSREDILEYLKQLLEEYNKEIGKRNFIEFYSKWCEDISLENQLGELFECLYFKKIIDNGRKLKEIKNDIIDFKEEYEEVYNKFIEKYPEMEKLLNN